MFEKLIYLYIIFLPLMKLPKLSFMGNKIQYADLIFIPLFLLYLFRLFQRRFKAVVRDRIDLSLILLIVISFLSFFHASAKKDIFLDFAGIVYLVSLYFVFTNFINKKQIFDRANFFLFVATLFVSISGILIAIFYYIFNIEKLSYFFYARTFGTQSSLVPFARTSSFLNLPEMFIGFILLGLSSAFVYRNSLRKVSLSKRRLVDFCIALIILSAFFAFSRSLVGLMLFLTLITFRFSKKSFFSSMLRIFCLFGFILLFSSAIIVGAFAVYPVSLSLDNITGIANFSFNCSLHTRVYLTKAALAIGREHPFLGLGLGSFTNHFRKFLSKGDIVALSSIRQIQPSLLKIDPHSLYFGAIAEIGYLGTSALLFMLFCFLSRIITAYKLANNNFYFRNSCYIYLSALLGYLLNGFFVDILSIRSFWVLLSLGIISANLAGQEHN